MIDNLIVKVAELCNLACRYCYLYEHGDTAYRGRPRFMSNSVFEGLLASITRYCDAHEHHQMQITLHGGEATLVGPKRFSYLATRAHEILGSRLKGIVLQTNATLINAEWVDVLSEFGVQVGVSLDGPPDMHNRGRVDHAGRGSYDDVVRGLRLLQEGGLATGVLAVVQPGEDGGRVHRHIRSLGVTRIDYMLPDITHDTRDLWYGALGAILWRRILFPHSTHGSTRMIPL